MRFISALILATPVIPAFGGWFTNHKNRTSSLCSMRCIALNASDAWWFFYHRQDPRQALVARDRDGKFIGFFYRPADKE